MSDATSIKSSTPGNVTASSRVYDDLRLRIVSFELKPDSTLDRSELAAHYGVSQSPVREAIQRLERDGLVESFPQSRTVVTRIDQSKIFDEHFLRVSLECEAVRQLAENVSEATLVALRGSLRMQQALLDDLDQISLFMQLDEAFHETILDGVGRGGLIRRIATMSGQLARARALDLPRKEKMRSVFEGHRDVVDAVQAGDPAAAMSAMRAHLSGTIERISTIRDNHPALFG